MKEETIRDELETALQGEDCGEEVVELAQDDVDGGLGLERVLTRQEGGGDKDADQDEVGADGMRLDLPAQHSEGVGLTEDEE